ncbi:MAG: DinB family protein [Ignavibacteriaceae bacterium]|nr:DinB family protein [Ignavibacteriaceae bacterium]
MTISEMFLEELKQEAAITRKILERVPLEKGDWKPHVKNFSLLQLATHVAELPTYLSTTINTDELDFAASNYKPEYPTTSKELLATFEKNLKNAQEALKNCSDEKMQKNWTMRSGDTIFFSNPRVSVIPGMCLNHMVHHRAQLGVYLRLLDVPVPGSYGPSADDKAGM